MWFLPFFWGVRISLGHIEGWRSCGEPRWDHLESFHAQEMWLSKLRTWWEHMRTRFTEQNWALSHIWGAFAHRKACRKQLLRGQLRHFDLSTWNAQGARRFQYNFLKFAHLRGCNETLVWAAISPITFSEIWPRRLRSTFEAGICGSLCLKRQKMRACSALLGCYSDAHVNSDWCFQKIQDCVLKLETDSV